MNVTDTFDYDAHSEKQASSQSTERGGGNFSAYRYDVQPFPREFLIIIPWSIVEFSKITRFMDTIFRSSKIYGCNTEQMNLSTVQ